MSHNSSITKKLILFAQYAEAHATLLRTHSQVVGDHKIYIWTEGEIHSLYQFEQGWIALTGIGMHAAQMATAKYAPFCDEVWNFGLAGYLKDTLPIGHLLTIDKIGKYLPIKTEELDGRSQECLTTSLPFFFLGANGSKLITSDFPIHDNLHRERLKTQWDLVDMEGYGIAFACSALGKKCRMWKIISDFASIGGRELLKKYRAACSEKIADTIIELLYHSP